jgi:predicted DNA-binding transcriptional regulator AlpA
MCAERCWTSTPLEGSYVGHRTGLGATLSRLSTNEPRDLIRGWAGVTAEVKKSRVQLWRDIRAGTFPAPIETGANSIAWFRAEVEAWKGSRPRRTYALPKA